MEAEAKSIYEIIIKDEPRLFEVPFFQRKYIWQQENWDELLESFTEDNKEKYLGSLIIKRKNPTKKNKLKIARAEIIDGQQRLTTIAILTKAIYDSIKSNKLKKTVKTENIYKTIFYTSDADSTTKKISDVNIDDLELKIKHSRLDADDYEKIMNYDIKNDKNPLEGLDVNKKIQKKVKKRKNGKKKNKIEQNKEKNTSNLLKCYNYYINVLKNKNDNDLTKLLDVMYERPKSDDDLSKRFVLMTLYDDENREQEIFDTINRAGQTLTSADIIKNKLFNILLQKFKMKKEEVYKLCDENWEYVFYENEDKRQNWNDNDRLTNIGEKTNIEILLLFIAIIEFPSKKTIKKNENEFEIHKKFASRCVRKLSDVYEDYLNNSTKDKIIELIKKIKVYAELFYKYYIDNEYIKSISCDDILKVTLLSMKQCKLKFIFPCIMSLLYKSFEKNHNNAQEDITIEKSTKDILTKLNKYILLDSITKTGAATNILAKNIMIIKSIDFIKQFFDSRDAEIRESLEKIDNNRAKILLFNLEIDCRDAYADMDLFNYSNIELEHIMPIKWEESWGKGILSNEKKSNNREQHIRKIGNMILLKDKMNRKIQNASFKDKMEGKKIKNKPIPGYIKTIDYKTSKDIVNKYIRKKYNWDELQIDNRTKEIANRIIKYLVY